jgi:hypothetical protein
MSRIFILGNGASLKDTPLELLKNEVTMGVNKIASIFDPTYYVKIDYSAWEKDHWMYEVFPQVVAGKPCLLWDVFRDGVQKDGAPFSDNIPKGIGDYPNVTWVSRCKHHGRKGYDGIWHDPFCTAWNSMVPMAQWAERLGFDKIYLVGCDGVFTDGITDHFMPYYDEVDLNYVSRNNECVQKAHEMIARSCKAEVYNATIGGIIENYPRVDLKEVLSA